MADLAGDRAVDPDAQAAVTDFLDYTEYLPSDLIRSLTLIRGLDETYLSNTQTLHQLTKIYGSLPTIAPESRPDAPQLRAQISMHQNCALDARESSFAEACRLFDVVERHQNRLKSILVKLKAIPKPPSRDPTPPQLSTAEQKRSRSGRKLDVSGTRLTLHPPRASGVASAILKRPRGRRITVPGEVMPPYDPDSPIASTEVSEWESPPPSPPRPILKLKQPKLPLAHLKKSAAGMDRNRSSRETTEPFSKPSPPPDNAPIGSKYRPWTHLTEYELYGLRKRMKKNSNWEPSDVMIRRELADRGRGWENYYRAKAEAQATGTPFIDIARAERSKLNTIKEGKNANVDGFEALDESEASGSSTGEESDDASSDEESHAGDKPRRRGIRKSTKPGASSATKATRTTRRESRRKGDADPARWQAAMAAQEAELAARRLGDIGSKFRTLFTAPLATAFGSLGRGSASQTAKSGSTAKRTSEGSSRKRKADEELVGSISPPVDQESARKRQKTAPKPSPLATSPISMPASTSTSLGSEPPVKSAGTIRIPLKLTVGTSSRQPTSTASTPGPATRATSTRRNSLVPKLESPPPGPSRAPSRLSVATSVEPPTTRSSRRPSATPSTISRKMDDSPKSAPTAASRRSKRDAPGTVTQSSQDGGAAVSMSKRKSKPTKPPRSATRSVASEVECSVPQIRIDVDGRQELVDPDEERYCMCGDVSWGEMICCEMDEKCDYGQWFHMECVSLAELPPRTVKWYCPGDRKRYHKGESSNGLVGRGIK